MKNPSPQIRILIAWWKDPLVSGITPLFLTAEWKDPLMCLIGKWKDPLGIWKDPLDMYKDPVLFLIAFRGLSRYPWVFSDTHVVIRYTKSIGGTRYTAILCNFHLERTPGVFPRFLSLGHNWQCTLYAPLKEFMAEIHDHGEYCKYGHIHQAIAKAYHWNKQQTTFCGDNSSLDLINKFRKITSFNATFKCGQYFF